MNLIDVAQNIARVYEIAQLGGFSVKLIAGENCPHIDQRDLKLFNDFFSFDADTEYPDMVIELCYGPQHVLQLLFGRSISETLDEVQQRIAQCEFDELEVDRQIDETSKKLLKTAIEQLNLGIADSIQVLDIAAVIAKMAKSKKIKVEHVAEAIQYKSYPG